MAVGSLSLDDLRREIDEIDDALHELLIRRAALMGDAASAAQRGGRGALAIQPAREAKVLRRLIARHRGRMPPVVIARIWREITNGAGAHGVQSVAVCAPEKSVAYWDLARNHFGSAMPMSLHRSATLVLRAVAERPGSIGVLPLPQEGEVEPWWAMLAGKAPGDEAPHVVWRFPFMTSPVGRLEDLGALALAYIRPEPSGMDVTLASLEVNQQVSRARLSEALQAVGLKAQILAVHEDAATNQRLYLAEIPDFVGQDDGRFEDLRRSMADVAPRVVVLGAYPAPLDGEERPG